jgi:hypothetical protein
MIDKIKQAMKLKDYKFFESGDYNLNIIGIRNSDTGSKVTNVFDDLLTVSYKIGDVWHFKKWAATTDPGTKGVKEFHNAQGVARLVPGQYRGSHAIGLHQGKYEALKQAKAVKVYRDANKDMTYDTKLITEGIYGINIHKAGADSTYVENWSEGCQVFKKSAEFDEFMALVKKAATLHGNSFTYTLLESKDL